MQRRTVWILAGLSVAILVLLLLSWRLIRCGGKRRDGTAAVSDRAPAAEDRRRRSADRAAAIRRNLHRLRWSAGAPRLLVGKVTAPDGTPVPSATIRVELPDRRILITRTGSSGEYRLAQVPGSAKQLEASARGYETRTFAPLTLPAAPQVRWDVTLTPARGIHGVVLSGEQPVSGVAVRLLRKGVRRVLASARTDLGGRFSMAFEGTAGTMHLLRAWHGQYGQGQVVVTGPGEVTIRLAGGGFVSGRVVDEHGQPVKQFSLSASSLAQGHGGPTLQTFDSGDGRFRLGPLAPGPQRIFAVAQGYQPAESRRLRIRSGETVAGVELRLKASGEVVGRVTDASTGQPIAGAQVMPAEWGSTSLGESVGAVSDANGHYSLKSVPGSRTSLRVRADGYQALLAGGLECDPGHRCKRDFALTPVGRDKRPSGQLTGVGAVLRKTNRGVLITQLLPGGPAADVLQRGDLVVMVGELDTTSAGLREVAQAIRGEVGTDVVLWILRGGQGEPQRVVIKRALVNMPARR
ncbi:MAG: carboxypeptidase regulatory-like domain-containing protein [bacterium]